MKYWQDRQNTTHRAAIVYQVYWSLLSYKQQSKAQLYYLFYADLKTWQEQTKYLQKTAFVKVVRLFGKLKGSFWSRRQQLYNSSSCLLNVKVIFPFSKQVAVIGVHTYQTAWKPQPSTSTVGWADDLWAAWATFLYVAQHCANSICWKRALQWHLRVFPQAEMQNQSSLSRISVAPTQLYCHPISFNLWANNSGEQHQKTLSWGCSWGVALGRDSSVFAAKCTRNSVMAGKRKAE